MASQTPIEDLSKEMSLLLRRDTTPEQAAHTPTASDAAEESTVSGPSSASPFACDTIPSRVKQYVPLKVATSSISGAGRGLFVLKDVAAGDLLFSIPFPALNIIASGPGLHGLDGVCDNCMHTKPVVTARGEIRTNPQKGFRLSACSKCQVVYYCGRKCQAAAWKRHHKFECAQLMEAKIRYNDSTTDVTKSRTFRCVLRLLQLYANRKISADEAAEFESLKHHLETMELEKFPEELAQYEIMCTRLKSLTQINVEEGQILGLIFAMINNEQQIALPLLKTDQTNTLSDPTLPAETAVGCCLEPFVALINHCCEANASWINEGPELRVRAERPIAANEEITFQYSARNAADYTLRQKEFQEVWGFECNCTLCQKGDTGPTGPLRAAILPFLEPLVFPSSPMLPQHIKDFETAIAAMKKAGFGYDAFGMRQLYFNVCKCYMVKQDWANALKTALTLYYAIDPAQTPALPASTHVNTLHCLMACVMKGHGTDAPLRPLMPALHYDLRRLLLKGLEKCYGKDSLVAIAEAADLVVTLKKHLNGFGALPASVLGVEKSRTERALFTARMNSLMEWAGLPALTFEQLMA